MKRYVIRRLLFILPAIFIMSTGVFFFMDLASGDVAVAILSEGGFSGTAEQLEQLKTELGLNDPLFTRYSDFMTRLVHGNLGTSMWTGQPVLNEIRLRVPVTLSLMLLSVLFSVIIAIPTGVVSAVRRNSVQDYLVRAITIAGLAVPGWIVAIFVIVLLVWAFNWSVPLGYSHLLQNPLLALQQLSLPAAILAFRTFGVEARMTRSCMLEILQADYIRTARAKGLTERVVIWVHALKNAVLPVITAFNLNIIFLFGGVVIMEKLFTIPGIGSFLADALERRDLTSIQGTLIVILVFVMLINVVTDIVYAWVDPRIRYK